MNTKLRLPKVTRSKSKTEAGTFPLDHYSYSSFVRFSTNPILFKIKYINRDVIDSTVSPVMVLGNAFHTAMEVYYGGSDTPVSNEAEAIEQGLKAGMEFIDKYPDGFIGWNTTIENRQKLSDKFAFVFNAYVKEKPYKGKQELVSIEELLEEKVDIEWRGKKLSLPVMLKCYTDKIVREDGRLKIVDYKTCNSFSNPEKIDAKKILQAVQYYFAVYAKYGEEPYSMIFEEVKHTKNQKGGKQVQEYEMVFESNEQFFDFYLRFYDDVTRAINGEMVWVPNIDAFYDNEVAIVSYIHRLDIEEERAAQMKAAKVENITDLLKKKIQNAGNMQRFMKTLEEQFVSAKSIDYSKMQPEEKIRTKLMEHGMILDFDSVVRGASVDLYRYTPSVGLKMARLASYAADVEQVLGVSGIRVLAPIPDSSFVGFEVPRGERTYPTLSEAGQSNFNLGIGVDTAGETFHFDIRQAPHMLVAGATGSGKSVFLNAVIEQLSKCDPAEIYLADPKMVELAPLQNLPNVKGYAHDVEDIHAMLKKAVNEMNARYKQMTEAGKRNIEGMGIPYQFYIVDEFGDLIAQNHVKKEKKSEHQITRGQHAGEIKVEYEETYVSKEIAQYLLLLAQKARAAGIHVIIATQRPSVDIITGTIKGNFPTKVAFRTAKAIDSQVILDENGPEKLLGKGDMLFSYDGGIKRLQGFNV